MSDLLQELVQQTRRELLEELTPEERWGLVQKTLQNLTPEERRGLMQQTLQDLTPDERRALLQETPVEQILGRLSLEDRLVGLTPAERAALARLLQPDTPPEQPPG